MKNTICDFCTRTDMYGVNVYHGETFVIDPCPQCHSFMVCSWYCSVSCKCDNLGCRQKGCLSCMKLCSDCWLAPPVAAADEYDSDYRDDPQRHECLLSEQCVMYCTGCKQSLCRMCAYKDTCQGYCHTPLCSQCRRQCLLCNETFCRQCSQQCRFCSSVFCHTCFDDNVCSTKCTALYKIEKRRHDKIITKRPPRPTKMLWKYSDVTMIIPS